MWSRATLSRKFQNTYKNDCMISIDSKNSGSESMELSEEGPSDIAGPPDDYNWHIFGWDRDRTSSMLKIEHYTGVKVLQAGGFKTAIGD